MPVMTGLQGTLIAVRRVVHDEPAIVSGLAKPPVPKFLQQYPGHPVTDPQVAGSPHGVAGGWGWSVWMG